MVLAPIFKTICDSLGTFIGWATNLQPFFMGIIISVVVGVVLVFAAAAGQKSHDHNGGQQDTDDLFNMKISFSFSCLDLLSCYSPHDKEAV